MRLKIKSFDLFHYAFIVPFEWGEGMRDDIIRPIFVQSGLISIEDYQDRLLFFSYVTNIFLREETIQSFAERLLTKRKP